MTDWRRYISKASPLDERELLDVVEVLKARSQLSQSSVSVDALLSARLSLEQLWAVGRFDRASTMLARRIYWLTWALVGLTVAMLLVMLMPLLKGN